MATNSQEKRSLTSRRVFLRNGTLFLGASALLPGTGHCFADQSNFVAVVRAGLITDLHFADKPAAGTRHYRETRRKLETASEGFSRRPPDFIVELGDLIDAADSVERELGYLKVINQDFSAICKDRHYVLGNHCVHTLTKREFLDGVGQAESSFSFDRNGIHFVVLDSCFRSDGQPYGRKNFQWTDPNIPPAQLEWLKADLAAANKPTVVFAHQRLDVANSHGVKNAPAVRDILEASGNVLAVFQGHSHKNDYHQIGGIHYCTLVAMVEGSGPENNAFSMLEVAADGSIRVEGFIKQKSYDWPGRKA